MWRAKDNLQILLLNLRVAVRLAQAARKTERVEARMVHVFG